MTESAIQSALDSHAFMQGLGEPHRRRLAGGAKSFTVAQGQYLTRDGEAADAFYLIQSGQVAIGSHLAERGAVPIQTVGAGEVVGWSWLLPPYRWQFDARAIDTVQGLTCNAEWLRQQCEQDHEFGYCLLKQLVAVISSRLTASRMQRLDIYK